MSVELKIKVKNLADEARTIRTEEQKLHGMEKWNLQHHRKTVVRNAARRSLMAYQICRGRDWESSASRDRFTRMSDYSEVKRMVTKYGKAEAIESLPKIEAALRLSGDDNGKDREDTRSHAA